MDLKTYGLKLKQELEANPSPQKAKEIAAQIERATYQDGTPLTPEDKGHIIRYIKYPMYDHKTGRFLALGADNSEFLKLVALVSDNIKDAK